MAVLGLRFCARAFSSCGKWGPLFIARASHYRGLSCCGAEAPDAQAQQLWLTGLVTPRHVGSSQTRARTRVPCIGRQILNHCATREAHFWFLINWRWNTIKVILIIDIISIIYILIIYTCIYLYIIYILFDEYTLYKFYLQNSLGARFKPIRIFSCFMLLLKILLVCYPKPFSTPFSSFLLQYKMKAKSSFSQFFFLYMETNPWGVNANWQGVN